MKWSSPTCGTGLLEIRYRRHCRGQRQEMGEILPHIARGGICTVFLHPSGVGTSHAKLNRPQHLFLTTIVGTLVVGCW
jgi:hypothetical protein